MQVISQDGNITLPYKGGSVQQDAKQGWYMIVCLASNGNGKIMGVYESMSRAKNILMEIAHQAESGRDFYYMPD